MDTPDSATIVFNNPVIVAVGAEMVEKTNSAKFNDLVQLGSLFADRYEIKAMLGKGDRKCTYLAHDNKVDRLVALSLVSPEAIAFDPDGTAREAHVLGRIGSHDNIVSLYDYGVDGLSRCEYMVFEYLGGGTLADYLRENGPLKLESLLRFGRQLCRGLSHLHSKGLVHRDVSPANVWLDDRLTAHLGDFDSAVDTEGQSGRRPITTNSFASPEELSGSHIGVQTDLYSLGRILYTLATADFDSTKMADLTLIRPDIPVLFANLIDSLLSPSPNDRPKSAEDVLRLLDDIGKRPDIGATIAAGEGSTIEFKGSLLHPRGPLPPELEKKLEQGLTTTKQVEKDLEKALCHAVTKTIAAFLNSEGGTLLVGVSDDGAVVGIEDDFPHIGGTRQNEDGWRQKLREIMNKALHSDIWSAVSVDVVPYQGHLVAVLSCSRRNIETWHIGSDKDDNDEHFYIRSTSATDELKGSSMVAYVRQHWSLP